MGGVAGLSESEQQVWGAFATGRLVDFGTGDAVEDDPATAGGWCRRPGRS
jgi:hypothetical protein